MPSLSRIPSRLVENIRLIKLRQRRGIRLKSGIVVAGAVWIARAHMARHVSAIMVKAFGIVRIRLIGYIPPLLAISFSPDFGDVVVDALAIAGPSDIAVMGVVGRLIDA